MKEALIGVVVGWILSQLTLVINDWVNRSEKRKNLKCEIEDLKNKADNIIDTCQFSLERMKEGGYRFTSASQIYTHVKEAVFPEIFSSYSSTERAGIIAVYEIVDNINERIAMPDDTPNEKLAKLCDTEIEAVRLSVTANEFLINPKSNRLINRDNSFQTDILMPKINEVNLRYTQAESEINRLGNR